MEYSKCNTCANRDVKCYECHAMSDIYNHHPCYKEEKSFWEELQLMLRDATNAQAEEAIKILQEKLVKNKDAASCDHLNANRIWVSRDVYDRIRNYPGPVIFDSVGVEPILVSQYPPKKAHK